MSLLTKISKGVQARPVKLVVHGLPGLGKSTFAAGAPDPLFVDCERRTNHLPVARIQPESWQEVLGVMQEVIATKPCQTLVIDTLDYMESMVWDHVCKADGATNIEKAGGGYGRGYNLARDQFNIFMRGVDKLCTVGIGCIMLAHSELKLYRNPAGEDYETFAIKLHKSARALVVSKVDAVGYACFEDFARKGKTDIRAKAITTGERVLKFEHNPSYESKAGIPLPASMGLNWPEFSKSLSENTKENA